MKSSTIPSNGPIKTPTSVDPRGATPSFGISRPETGSAPKGKGPESSAR